MTPPELAELRADIDKVESLKGSISNSAIRLAAFARACLAANREGEELEVTIEYAESIGLSDDSTMRNEKLYRLADGVTLFVTAVVGGWSKCQLQVKDASGKYRLLPVTRRRIHELMYGLGLEEKERG